MSFLKKTSWTGWQQLVISVIGTTISIILTFGTTALVNNYQHKKDRELASVRVMGNIEAYARQMETVRDGNREVDSLGGVALSLSSRQLSRMPEDSLRWLLYSVIPSNLITYDKTAEQIFTSDIDTWRNVDNARFLDGAGQCFHIMDSFAEEYNKWLNDFIDYTQDYLIQNPQGKAAFVKYFSEPETRQRLSDVHLFQDRMSYLAALLRWLNRQNMKTMDIPEEVVMNEVVDSEEWAQLMLEDPVPVADEFTTPRPGLVFE